MPNYTASITVDAVIDALGAFLAPLCPGSQIVRAQTNRVAMPDDPFVVLTELLQVDLETPALAYSPSGALLTISGPKRIDVQVDFYGSGAGDMCTTVKTVFRTPYAPAQFADGVKPLYCSDGHQAPLISGEQQYESRWTLVASLQYNPTITVPQQFAHAVALNIVEDLQ